VPVKPANPKKADPVKDAESLVFSNKVVSTILLFMVILACLAIVCIYLAQAAGYFGAVPGEKGLWRDQYEKIQGELDLCTARQFQIDKLTIDLNETTETLEEVRARLEATILVKEGLEQGYMILDRNTIAQRAEIAQLTANLSETTATLVVVNASLGATILERNSWEERYLQLDQNTTAVIDQLTTNLSETTATLKEVSADLVATRQERNTWERKFRDLGAVLLSGDNASALWKPVSWGGEGNLSLPVISTVIDNPATGDDHLKIEIGEGGEEGGVAIQLVFSNPLAVRQYHFLSIGMLGGYPPGVSVRFSSPDGESAMVYDNFPNRVAWQRYIIPISDFEAIGDGEKPGEVGRMEIGFTNPGTCEIGTIILYR
jgi:hypothetical protein